LIRPAFGESLRAEERMAFAHIERSGALIMKRAEWNRCFADWHSERKRSAHD
jgi:hypothetical protein